MPIIFSSEKARRHLLEKGFVYTFRIKQRKQKGPVVKDWVTDRRCGRKIVDVIVMSLGLYFLSELSKFASGSGFDSLEEWIEETKSLNKGKLLRQGWLYKVQLSDFNSSPKKKKVRKNGGMERTLIPPLAFEFFFSAPVD